MSVTKQNIINQFGATEVEQIGSKQLFTAKLPNGKTALISYYTIVGYYMFNTWYLTKQKYSVTTSKQMSQFAKGRIVHYVDDINNFVPITNVNGIE